MATKSILKRDRPIDAGDLDQPLEFFQASGAVDAHGHKTASTSVASLFGNIRMMAGNELFIARQVQAKATHKVTIRYQDALDTSMWIDHSGRSFEILSIIDPDQRREFLEILSVEVEGVTP